MEEKNLLKEITYLSRLIGQHKQGMTSGYVYPYAGGTGGSKQYLRNVKSNIQPCGASRSFSKYQKVNNFSLGETISHEVNPLVESSRDTQVLPINTSASTSNVSQNKSGHYIKQIGVPSIHVNPRYLSSATHIPHIPAVVKSVHLNPKLLCVSKETGYIGEQNVLSSHGCTQFSFHKKETASLPSSTKQPYNRKRYVYQSKTKIVTTTVNSPQVECAKKVQSQGGLATESSDAVVKKNITNCRSDSFLAVSRTKLVRVPIKAKDLNMKEDSVSTTITPSPNNSKLSNKLRRSLSTSLPSQTVKIAKKVSTKYRTNNLQCSKYKVDHRLVRTPKRPSRYQVDRRAPRSSFRTKKCSTAATRSSHLLFSPLRRTSFGNRVWAPSSLTPKIKISHKRLSRIGSSHVTSCRQQNSALVRIGGVLYKTSRTKLTRSRTEATQNAATVTQKGKSVTIITKCKLNMGNVVYVRGNKFVMDRSGKTLKRVSDSNPPSSNSARSSCNKKGKVSRVDIGGVTFVQKTPSLLIRTNTHTARNVLSSAKQKSIAVLNKKMHKNNHPCLFYRRFGKCPRMEKGRCELLHDPKHIDICKMFLQGRCKNETCLLSHMVGPEKMPTCRFFLEGCCARDDCQYVHVKVNAKAALCGNFLKGYCSEGKKCLKRHFMVCPDFDKNGICRKGKYCTYPHPTQAKVVEVSDKDSGVKENNQPKVKRYYENNTFFEELKSATEVNQAPSPEIFEVSVEDSSEDIETPRKRPKIGDLPSFIALSTPEPTH